MKFQVYVLLFFSTGSAVVFGAGNELMLVHVIFRHGNRTINNADETYPLDPYLNETYDPTGYAQLTIPGKNTIYTLGKSLRARYDDFLGKYYSPKFVEAYSSDTDRTKESLLLLLAGLFPPNTEEMWNSELKWLPIPYNYSPVSQDWLLSSKYCRKFQKLYLRQRNSLEEKIKLQKYNKLFKYLSKHTGLNIKHYRQVYALRSALITEKEWGFKLPQWAEAVLPTLNEIAAQDYLLMTATRKLEQLSTGYLLEKIISDTKLKIKDNNHKKKIHLYSGHECNVAPLLSILGGLDPPHVPEYGSNIIFEVYKRYVKIYYGNYKLEKPRLLKLPNCDQLCDINNFFKQMEEYVPDENMCGGIELKYLYQTM